MQRFLALALAVLMVFSMTACAEKGPSLEDRLSRFPVDGETGEKPAEPAPSEEPVPPEEPEIREDPADEPAEAEHAVFNGVYRDLVTEQEGETAYVEITAYHDFILLEHFLCMEGSVYSFWAEEFWPGIGVYPEGNWHSVHGKSQTFSSMTMGDQYDAAPKERTVALTEDGIALTYDDSDTEYYIRDSSFSGHTSKEELRSLQSEDTLLDFEYLYESKNVLGTWDCREGGEAVCLTFEEDGAFSMLRKFPGRPAEIFKGVFGFGEFSGNLEIRAEKIGSGTYPYAVNWEWTVDGGELTVWDWEQTLLKTEDEGLSFRPAQHGSFTDLTQQDALSYLYNSYDLWGDYTDGYETEYTYRYRLPQFYGDSEAVEEVNDRITELYGPIIEEECRAMEESEFLSYDTVDWEVGVFENVLYLHIFADSHDWEEHSAYYLDLHTEAFLTPEEVLDRLLIDSEYFLQAVREDAEARFLEMHENIPPEEREEYGYYDVLEWTVSEEAVNFDVPIFVDQWGTIWVYARIGTPAGSGITWEILCPFEGAVG